MPKIETVAQLIEEGEKQYLSLCTEEKDVFFNDKFLSLTIEQLLEKMKKNSWDIFFQKEIAQKPTASDGNITYSEPSIVGGKISVLDFLKTLN